VLAAARDLFDQMGYEQTTIRMVAEQATVSIGSVFTCFSSKAELLSHVMDARLDGLYGEMEAILPHLRGATADRLRSIMAAHYGFETRRLRLFVTYISASFTWAPDQRVTPVGQNHRLKTILTDTLRAGMARGEVRPDTDVELFIDALLAAYIWNYRHACYENASAERMIELMDRQIGLLFDGVAAR
jgi:AcrR family transcriptional regulator